MKKKFLITLFIAGYFFTNKTLAQESIIPDVSYLFIEKLIATAKENYPRVKSYAIRSTIAKVNISRQKMSWFDLVGLQYIYQPNNTLNLVTPNIFSGYQLGINLNFGVVARKPYDIKEAKELAKVAKLDEDEYNGFIEQEVKRRYILYIESLNSVKLYTKSLQDVQNLMSGMKGKFEKGEVTFDEYTQGLLAVTSSTQAKLQAEATMFSAKSSLEELIVKKLEEVK